MSYYKQKNFISCYPTFTCDIYNFKIVDNDIIDTPFGTISYKLNNDKIIFTLPLMDENDYMESHYTIWLDDIIIDSDLIWQKVNPLNGIIEYPYNNEQIFGIWCGY